MKKALLTIVLCGLIVVAGVGATVVTASLKGSKTTAEASAPTRGVKVTNVEVAVLATSDVDDRLVLTGRVEPWQDIISSAEVAGRIEAQSVQEGDFVRAGQALIRIDTRALQARLRQAEAAQRLAIQELERIQSLSRKNITTAQNLDRMRAERDMSAADLELVRIQIEKSVLKSPIDGIIDTLFKDQDEFTDTGSALMRIVQVHKVKVRVGIPERDVAYFAKGDSVTVTLDALQGREFPGKIHCIGTTAEAATLTFIAEIEVDNAEGAIKPGMIARATLVRRTFPDSIVVPIFAVLSVENERFVFVENDGVAEGRRIEIGVLASDKVQVVDGLSAGDRLIVVGQRDLRPGDRVNVAGFAQ
ncbi:MAG: efflux RND transporter periplasmic adaptor subunit [Nitrospiraceae bacterium]|nr:efflux RND transporter periplasmic adaptor subunit [Nitrospiraceae bacterium]